MRLLPIKGSFKALDPASACDELHMENTAPILNIINENSVMWDGGRGQAGKVVKMVRKGVSADEKRTRLLNICYDAVSF